MLHAKFQDNRNFGSREEDVLTFFTYIGVAANLVMYTSFVPPLEGGSI